MQFETRRLSVAGLALLAVGLVDCRSGAPKSSSPQPVVLKTDKRQYRAGEPMTLTLENKSATSFTFNPCTRTIERQDGSSWTTLPDEGRMCTMEAWVLDPHGTRSGPTELPGAITAGRYRVVVRLVSAQTTDGTANAVTAVSDPITVN